MSNLKFYFENSKPAAETFKYKGEFPDIKGSWLPLGRCEDAQLQTATPDVGTLEILENRPGPESPVHRGGRPNPASQTDRGHLFSELLPG